MALSFRFPTVSTATPASPEARHTFKNLARAILTRTVFRMTYPGRDRQSPLIATDDARPAPSLESFHLPLSSPNMPRLLLSGAYQ